MKVRSALITPDKEIFFLGGSMNLLLKIALIERRTPQYRTAMEADIRPDKVSKFISGLANPSTEEKQRLSQVLGKPVADLFPSSLDQS